MLVFTTASGVANVVGVALGLQHRCALRGDGTVRCWGANTKGQLGRGSLPASELPGTATAFAARAISIRAGADQTCGLLGDASVNCVGGGTRRELGAKALDSAFPLAPSL